VSRITHVELAFMQSSLFNSQEPPSEWPLFTTVETVRSQFAEGTAIMVAIGGWGDTEGFSRAAASEESRALFAQNVKAMVDETGADGRRTSTSIMKRYTNWHGQALISIGNTLGKVLPSFALSNTHPYT
jgi:hypothetical protein